MSNRPVRTMLAVGVASGAAVAVAVALRDPGAAAGLACLAPAALGLLLATSGRYPGERILLGLSRPVSRRAQRTQRLAFTAGALCRRPLPRGGLLLAAALAGRAPPAEPRPL